MNTIRRHITRCVLAGIIAILPVGGMVLGILWAETTIAESWRDRVSWYFPGLGLLAVAAAVYVLGLIVSTFLGRWLWRKADSILKSLPGLGRLYQTLKQLLGYGEGKDAIFSGAVLVPSPFGEGSELGLVSGHTPEGKLIVFVPGSPNPGNGRLVMMEREHVATLDAKVSDVLKMILSVGATPLPSGGVRV